VNRSWPPPNIALGFPIVAASANPPPGALAGLSPASFGPRFAALMIDWAFCLVASSLFGNPVIVAWPASVLLIVLNTVGIGFFGRTLGMTLARIRCISYADAGAIGPWKGLIRAVLLALLIPAVILDSQTRGLHDRAAGSVVVALPKPPRD
jgi:uncharacterized RDD family membrane protein YckC